MRCRNAMVAVCAMVFALGCGSGEPALYEVSGAVTLNGKPIPEGEVTFVAENGLVSAPGPVKDGRYTLQTTAGKKTVRILAMKVKPGGARDAFGAPTPENYLPPRYNTQSTLSAEVTPKGPNQFDFPLTD